MNENGGELLWRERDRKLLKDGFFGTDHQEFSLVDRITKGFIQDVTGCILSVESLI
jgi:hypothetical protein